MLTVIKLVSCYKIWDDIYQAPLGNWQTYDLPWTEPDNSSPGYYFSGWKI